MRNPRLDRLTAPPEYWMLTDAEKKKYCNGCGSKYFKVPKRIWFCNIEEA